MKRLLGSMFLLLSTAALAADDPVAEPALWPCVESVVIARIERVGEMVEYDTEDLVIHPPSYVDIRIRRVLSGVTPPKTLTIIHQPELQRGDAMFLLGRRKGQWIRLGFEGRVARDRDRVASASLARWHSHRSSHIAWAEPGVRLPDF